MSDDFGYFGKGMSGYAHYMQTFKETQKGGGGGRRPSSNSGCLTSVILALCAIGGVTVYWL